MPRDSAHAFAAAATRWSLVGGAVSLAAFAALLQHVPLPILAGVGAALLVMGAGTLVVGLRIVGSAALFLAACVGLAAVPVPLPVPLPGAAAAALLVPLLAGWRVHALDLALRFTGRKPRALPPSALWSDALPPARATFGRVALGIARRYARGLALPVLALRDAFAPRERLHARAGFDEISLGFTAAGATCEARGSALHVTLADGRRARLRRGTFAFPCVDASLTLRGEGAHEARRLLESDLSHLCVFAYTQQGRRWEARLNAMLRDAHVASTLEERSLLLEEAQRVEDLLGTRALLEEEWTRLRGWKAQRLRVQLATKLLSEPVGARTEGRLLAPHPALAPELSRVIEAGGLASVKRLVLVPHWILPVRSSWGEREVLVNALTGKLDPDEALLDAAREKAPSHFVDAPRSTNVMPAPEATAAVLRELRTALGPGVDVEPAAGGSADVLLVPFVPTAEGYLNAVTGARAADLGAPPAMAAAPR
jgi:hypothetical protein